MKTAAQKYLADLSSGGLFLAESRCVAELLRSTDSEVEWYRQIVDANALQKRSEHTALRYARTIRRRLVPLGDDFIDDVINAHEALYKQLLLLATMIKTPAGADFMAEVVREAKRVYLPSLPADAWDQFMANKSRQLDGLVELSESTLKKSGSNAIRILVEADYLNNNRSRLLQPVYLLPETRRWLVVLDREDLKPIMECTL